MGKIMNVIRRFIGRLLFPRKSKFTNNLQDSYLEAVGETLQFDTSIKDLSAGWIAVCPYTYFSELFLFGNEKWTYPFVRAFDRSNIVDAQGCYCLTQGFFLRNLFKIISRDEKYRIYSQENISHNIRSNMRFGSTILAFSDYFQKTIDEMVLCEDLAMCYVEKVLEIQYPGRNILEPLLSSIWTDTEAVWCLNLFTTETVKRAKSIDSQSALDS